MKYRLGYCHALVDNTYTKKYEWLKNISDQCEKFILGIPDNDIAAKICGNGRRYNAEAVRNAWMKLEWIADIVILDADSLSYQKIYKRIPFDACFYGSEYGLDCERDRVFAEEKGIDFLPIFSSKLTVKNNEDALELSLRRLNPKQKIILFGTGKYFDYYMKNYGEKYVPSYAIDNDEEKWGTWKNEINIKAPDCLRDENKEDVLVVICAKDYSPMLRQLRELGDFAYRLLLNMNEVALLEEFRITKEADAEVLRRLHEINHQMLKDFDRTCRKHNVEYVLNYGSLLGAIRHKGFIPWDNDVDICMTRENLEKLLPYVNEFGDNYHFVPPEEYGKKKYLDSVPRLQYKYAYMRLDEDACRFYGNRNNRVDLDIFLIDKTYDTFRGKYQRFKLAVLYGMMNAYRHESFFFDYSKKMRIANNILRTIGRCIPLQMLRKHVDKVARRFNHDPKAKYYFISNCALNKLKLLFPEDIFRGTVDVPFEDLSVMVPTGYEEMLHLIFGNYMKLPPLNKRVPHWGRIWISCSTFVFEEPEV